VSRRDAADLLRLIDRFVHGGERTKPTVAESMAASALPGVESFGGSGTCFTTFRGSTVAVVHEI
jgi:hypothetical protein